jgi:XTP/dITP diphosphohydrolase
LKSLIVATTNSGKLREITECIKGLDYHICSLADLDDPPEIIEDADTFEGNAQKKATTIAEIYGRPTLSDDSGLEVDALDGAPGVHSARFGGPELSDQERCEFLLDKMRPFRIEEERGCRFQTVMVYATLDSPAVVFTGTMVGTLAFEPRGKTGFGYDPIFIPAGMDKTVAELGPEIKNRISHRAKALRAFSEFIHGRKII